MEIAKKEQSPAVSSLGSKLRNPLRSSIRSSIRSNVANDTSYSSSASRRVRPSTSVSQSGGPLDLSAKDISAKPPRRLSIPTKSNFSPRQPSVGSITPISETRLNRSNVQGKSDTPLSEASKSAGRRKFNVLSSVSYWLTQIKLSESASKHSISLGFFKLALMSGCEPLQRIREELKSYVYKYNLLTELEEPVKDLLQNYNILEELDQLKLSENNSQLPEEGISASKQGGKLKPRSLISSALTGKESKKKEIFEKRVPMSNDKALNMKNRGHRVNEKDTNANNSQKKTQKPKKVELNHENAKAKSSTKDSINKEADIVPTEEASHGDKENIVEDKENMEYLAKQFSLPLVASKDPIADLFTKVQTTAQDFQSMDGAMLMEEILTG